MRLGLPTSTAILTLTLVYFIAGKLGLSLAFIHASASAVWPPSGIALAALLLWGYRLWPGIFFGAFLVNITTQGSLATTLAIATGNTLEALLGAWAITRFANGPMVFERARNILKFILFAPILSTVVSATIGVSSLTLGGFAQWDRYWAIWFTWWLGDAVGDLIVAPLLVIWLTQPYPKITAPRLLEAIGLLFSLILVTCLMVLLDAPASSEYMMVLPLLWAAFRFGPRGVVAAGFTVSAIAIVSTINSLGAFAHTSPHESLLHLQSYMGTIAIAALVLSSVIAQGKRAEQRLLIQDAISRILAESPALKEAAAKVVQVLCERARWDLGVIWEMDRAANELRCVEVCHLPTVQAPAFETVNKEGRFSLGAYLPGRVWSTGKAEWIPDLATNKEFGRAPTALKEGFHSVFGFPIKLGGKTLAVIECFSREVREPDDHFLQLVSDIGGQLGQFVERKRAEDLLADREERLRAVVETAVDGIITIDDHGTIGTVNPAAERIFGFPAAELIGQNIRILMAEPYRSEHNSYIDNYLRTGDRKVIGIGREVHGRRKDGETFPLDLAVSETRVGRERIFIGIVRDISERKRADELLQRAKDDLVTVNKELERRVAERTTDLEQTNAALRKTLEEQKLLEAQLRQAQKMESIGTLAGGIAHDFNNILNIIGGYATLIGQLTPTDGQIKDSLRIIDQEIERGASVVRQLMTVARKSETRLVRADVNEIVLMVNQLIKTFPKTISVDVELDPAPMFVLADSNKLTQAFLNICVNARDAMPTGGKLTIETKTMATDELPGHRIDSGAEEFVRVTISDTGTGMDEEVRERIFEPFFTTKSVGEGTGLGLAIVYGIVKEHNGFIEVASQMGHGTMFRIYLPRLRSDAVPNLVPIKEKVTARKQFNGQRTVLVVEDEENLVRLLKNFLPQAGYKVLAATDGELAIELYHKHQAEIDIVLLDLGLPKIPGLDVMAKLQEQNPQVKIIITTGYLAADLKAELLRTGVKDCIHKPYLIDDILDRMGSFIEES